MATFYLDLVGGNDANDGTTFANRWKTFASGATAARTAPGDTIRIMASPNETLVGSATWTNASRTVTLAGAVTATICNCETVWTPSTNVTAGTGAPANQKEGSALAVIGVQAAFTTGLAAYFATGALDLSAYQQVSFWVSVNVALAASTCSLRLCSDTAGATTVHTIPLPPIAGSGLNNWYPVTVDLGTNMSASINSVALYCDADPGAISIRVDHIIACKASSSADSLTLTSLLGKVHNVSWLASTTYAVNDIRRPTQPNRNGYKYKVTAQTGATGSSEPSWPQGIGESVVDGGVTWLCEGLEDTWYGIASINGTTVILDGSSTTFASSGAGGKYPHATETIATYKREPVAQLSLSSISATFNAVQEGGSSGLPITYSGGWNRTDMSTQTGETWLAGGNWMGVGFTSNGMDYVTLENFNSTRFAYGIQHGNKYWRYKNCHHNHNSLGGFTYTADAIVNLRNVVTSMGASGTNFANFNVLLDAVAIQANGTLTTGYALSSGGSLSGPPIRDIWAKGNNSYGFSYTSARELSLNGFVGGGNTTNNLGALGTTGCTRINLVNHLSGGGGLTLQATGMNAYIYSQKHDQTADNHLITTDGGTIISATDQRHTASGIAWKFRPTLTSRDSTYPLRLSLAKVALSANALVTINVWTYRDNTNINGKLLVLGGQLAGVGADVSVSCAPSINTWTQSGNLTFTPTEDGVIEVLFLVWDGVGTANNFWVDDISISQA